MSAVVPREGFFASGDPLAGSWKSLVIAAVSRVRRAPLAECLELNLQFLFARPKKDAVRFMRARACFIDNLETLTQEALTQANAWIDEDQVVRIQSIKRYALPEENPGVHIEIVTLPQPSEELFQATVAWIDGIRIETLTEIYAELNAYSSKRQAEVRRCVEQEMPYKGHTVTQFPPVKHKKPTPSSASLLPGLITHRLGYNSGRF
jgi:Holliday junction resolvase RusA-like endonuclease